MSQSSFKSTMKTITPVPGDCGGMKFESLMNYKIHVEALRVIPSLRKDLSMAIV
jgi:hypothetical protein